MNTTRKDQEKLQIDVLSDIELNVLQVAVDDIITHLEEVLSDEEEDYRHVIEERLSAARNLKERLDVEF
jgi:hypothetical protein